jgi:hypothetical protein
MALYCGIYKGYTERAIWVIPRILCEILVPPCGESTKGLHLFHHCPEANCLAAVAFFVGFVQRRFVFHLVDV